MEGGSGLGQVMYQWKTGRISFKLPSRWGNLWSVDLLNPFPNPHSRVQKVVRLNGSQIFVSINYRLLLLGFPAGTEAREGGFMNLGLHDQRLALQWIQENIVTFGGDPRRVTFSGERSESFFPFASQELIEPSAGGTAILQHLVAYNGRDDHLFSAAIVQSGSFFDMRCHWNISDIRQAEYERLLADTECKEGGWDCLKEMDIKVLAEVSQRYYRLSTPAIDGDLLPVHAVELWANGSFLKVPLLMGCKFSLRKYSQF